jgi:hypothetical protein
VLDTMDERVASEVEDELIDRTFNGNHLWRQAQKVGQPSYRSHRNIGIVTHGSQYRRTCRPGHRAKSELAAKATARYDLTLDQAAVLAEFFVMWTQRALTAKPVAGVGLAGCG